MKITMIGAGNVATHMTQALSDAGHTILQVWSRTPAHAAALAERVGAAPVTRLSDIFPHAGLYLFSVKDDALSEVIDRMPATDGVWAHTAGSLPMEIFSSRKANHGVLYPLQTFSRQRGLSFGGIPLFIEGSNPETIAVLEEVASTLSGSVYRMPDEKRKKLHLAAVFACNFVNHLYALSAELIRQEDIPFEVLLPLITETAAKVKEMAPMEAQTGPAVRNDKTVMRQQMEWIDDLHIRELYRLLSESIVRLTKSND